MDKSFGWWIDLDKVSLTDSSTGSTTWVHALPFGKYQHPLHGEMNFDHNKLSGLATSVKTKVRGIDPDIDYDHKEDPAKGRVAAGWVKDADVRTDGLWLQVDFTGDASKEVKDKKYRYFSAEFADKWTDALGKEHQDVLLGGGLTNRPYMKNLMPVNLSELFSVVPPEEVDEVDGKKLRLALGLAEDTTDEAVFAKLGELGTSVTAVVTLTEKNTQLEAEVKALKDPNGGLDPDLKKLIEGSPAFKALYEQSQDKDKKLAELQAGIRLAEVNGKIAEIQSNKDFALSPTARETAKQLLLKADGDSFTKLFEFLGQVVDGSAVVDLTEKGHQNRRDAGDPTLRFNEAVKAAMAEDKALDYGTAVEKVARTNPRLFEEYRNDNYSFRA